MAAPLPSVVPSSPRSRWRRLLVAAGLGLLLSGCANPAPFYEQAFGYQCAEHNSKMADFVCNKSNQPKAKSSRYCYSSLGDTNCFDRPDPNPQNQPLGSSG